MSLALIARAIWTNPGNRGRQLRRMLDAVQWQLQKRTTGSVRLLRLPNGLWFNAYPDCVVSSALIYSDWPEHDELMFVRRTLRRGDVVIDVGANVGHISLLLADVVGGENIIAFEPAPGAFQRLTENWRMNGFPSRGLSQMAIGAWRGEVFIEAQDHPTTTLRVSVEEDGGRCARVPQVRLDDCRNWWMGRPVGLLKVDVEGWEPDVFEGSRRVLTDDRPRLIMFESLCGTLDARLGRIFAAHGYVVFQLDQRGRPEFNRFTAQNLFACPREICASALAQ